MAESTKIRRIVIVAPMRSHCETIRVIFENGPIPTYLTASYKKQLAEFVEMEKTFGIVAGTGVGKTVFLRDICERQFGMNFNFDVVTREKESTPHTWECPVLVITSGIAMHYLRAGYIDERDVILIDEIHQTSAHLELVMALAKHKCIKVCWMSATIDPCRYRDYFGTNEVLSCYNRDPNKRAQVENLFFQTGRGRRRFLDDDFESRSTDSCGIETDVPWIEHYLKKMGALRRIAAGNHGTAVFLPTRALCEKYADKYKKTSGLSVDFYHGGEQASKLRAYLKGEVPKPFIIFMTIAGASSLNIEGLDWVIIHDEMYKEVIYYGVKALQKVVLGPNEILQMSGRVDGRVAGGRVTILSGRRIQYETLRPQNPEFVLSGDLEEVALTCAKMQIDLSELDPIDEIDRVAYRATWGMLMQRGLITADNKLTEYGQEVAEIPVPRVWAEHIVQADPDILPFIVATSCVPSLYQMINRNGEYDIKDFIVRNNDFLTKYRIIQYILDHFVYLWNDRETGEQSFRLQKEFFDWAKEKGIYTKTIKEVLVAIASVCRALRIPLDEVQDDFPEVTPEVETAFKKLLVKVNGFALINCTGRKVDGLGLTVVQRAKTSVCARGNPMFGQISVFRNGQYENQNIEGVELDFADVAEAVDAENRQPCAIAVSEDGQKLAVTFVYPGFGSSEFIRHTEEMEELGPWAISMHRGYFYENWQAKAETAFAQYLAEHPELLPENDEVLAFMYRVDREIRREVFSPQESARKCYERILAGTAVYNFTKVSQRQFSLKLNLRMFFLEWQEAEFRRQFSEIDARKIQLEQQAARCSNSMSSLHAAFLENIGLDAWSPAPRGARLSPLKSKNAVQPAVSKSPRAIAEEKQKKLEEQADAIRAEITALQAELTNKKRLCDEAGASYDAAFRKRQLVDHLSDWQSAVRAVEKQEKAVQAKQAELKVLEDQILELMEQLESA